MFGVLHPFPLPFACLKISTFPEKPSPQYIVSPLLYRASFLLLQSTCYSGNCYTYLINVGLIH